MDYSRCVSLGCGHPTSPLAGGGVSALIVRVVFGLCVAQMRIKYPIKSMIYIILILLGILYLFDLIDFLKKGR